MSLPSMSASGSRTPTTPGYTPPAAPQPYLPNVSWLSNSTNVAPRDSINKTASGAKTEDQQVQVVADGQPLAVHYGQTQYGARIADVLSYQGALILVAVWGEGEIQAITALQMDGKTPPVSVTATHYTGTAGQTVNATLVAAYAAAGITYTDALPGIAYSVIRVPSGASQGFPTFTATIQGRKLYDPRTTLTAYSDNPALALADFLSNATYGLNKTVDWASVEEAADACDTILGTEKRRLIGLACDNISGAESWIDTLRTYASCHVVQGDQGVRLIPDQIGTTAHTFDASNIQAGTLKLRKRGIQQVPTVMRVNYTDTTTTPWRTNYAEIQAAGVDIGTTPRRESNINLPGVQRYSQAYREAVERLNKLTLGDLLCDFDTFDEALAVEVADIIEVTHPIGLTSKKMRVTAIAAQSPGRWRISAAEYDPAMYSTTVAAEPSFSDTDLPSPAEPPAVAGLTVSEEVYQLENGNYSSRIRATWTPGDYPYLAHYRVEVYQAGTLVQTGTTSTATFATQALQEGNEYVVKVAAVTTIGAAGAWSQGNITAAGKYLIPGNVPSVQVFEAGGRLYLSWEPAVDIDIWRYEVRYGPTAGTWDDANLIDRVDALRLMSDEIPEGTWKVYVKALDSVGQYSTTAATATVTVTSDASAFFVDSYDSDTPTLTNMSEFNLGPTDPNRYFVTEDGTAFGTRFSSNLGTYGNALATYHNSITSTWLGEAEDFGLELGGQWTGTATVAALTGSLASYTGLSLDGSAWTYHAGLSQKEIGRFARLKHEALTTSTLLVTVPEQNIRLDAIPREEAGSGTSSASAAVTITLENAFVAVKKLTLTPSGATARMAVYDNIVLGSPSTFDVRVFDAAGAQIASPFLYQFQGV